MGCKHIWVNSGRRLSDDESGLSSRLPAVSIQFVLSVFYSVECYYLNAIAIQYILIYTYIYIYITYNAIIIQCYNHVMYVIVESSPLLVIVPLRVYV